MISEFYLNKAELEQAILDYVNSRTGNCWSVMDTDDILFIHNEAVTIEDLEARVRIDEDV